MKPGVDEEALAAPAVCAGCSNHCCPTPVADEQVPTAPAVCADCAEDNCFVASAFRWGRPANCMSPSGTRPAVSAPTQATDLASATGRMTAMSAPGSASSPRSSSPSSSSTSSTSTKIVTTTSFETIISKILMRITSWYFTWIANISSVVVSIKSAVFISGVIMSPLFSSSLIVHTIIRHVSVGIHTVIIVLLSVTIIMFRHERTTVSIIEMRWTTTKATSTAPPIASSSKSTPAIIIIATSIIVVSITSTPARLSWSIPVV
mmetsp:Transcript_22668/g.63220  ORF Transcript_22668/g.63220 Transcript_22668/m.63220 type:complete len:262 (-) Transcript_22668:63-848(-)